jgi:lipopolysaccharide export system permease protein
LFTAPFALSLNRKGKALTVGYAVGLWLLYMGVTAAFDQFGLSGALPPEAAVWGPLILFAMLGAYLLTRVRT